MLANSAIEEYKESHLKYIYVNDRFENLDAFGDAVNTIKEAAYSPDILNVEEVMHTAIIQAMDYFATKRHTSDTGYCLYSRDKKSIVLDDLEFAALVKYLPKRLFNFLCGFQAESMTYFYIEKVSKKMGYKCFSGDLVSFELKKQFGTKENGDMQHHIDVMLTKSKGKVNEVYLVHIFKDSYWGRRKVQDKLIKYIHSKKVTPILKHRHAVTYTSFESITYDSIKTQLEDIVAGGRAIRIKPESEFPITFVDLD